MGEQQSDTAVGVTTAKPGGNRCRRLAASGLLALLLLLCPALPAAARGFATLERVYEIIDARYIDDPNYGALARGALSGVAELVKASGRPVAPEVLDAKSVPDDKFPVLSALSTALEKVHTATGISNARLEDAAIHGMVNGLDPHSSFLSTESVKELEVEIKGAFGGIGLQLALKDKALTVISPIDDTPAFLAGIKPGDRIIRIDGTPTDNLSINDAVNRIRGEKDTRVTLSILREGWEQPRNFELIRDTVNVKNVRSRLLGNGIGYLRISQFILTTPDELDTALNEMGARFGRLKGLILDLRNNSGGVLEAATEVADRFIDSEQICSIRGRAENPVQKITGRSIGTYPPFPIIVLINEGSASGAEIVAGALQDQNLAILIGKRSFGKGSVQSMFLLPDRRQLRLTTGEYFLPGGHSVRGGIAPDLEVGEQEGEDLPMRMAEAVFGVTGGRQGLVSNDQLKGIAIGLTHPGQSGARPAPDHP